MNMDVRSQRNGSLMERQRSWPRKQRSKRGGYFQGQERECVRSVIEPNDHEYSNRGAYVQQRRERECVRSIIEPNDHEYPNRGGYNQHREQEWVGSIKEPNDHEYSNNFEARFLQQEFNTEYPRSFHTKHSTTWSRPVENARPVENSPGLYMAEDVRLNQPFSQPNVPQRRRYSDGPSYNHSAEDVVPHQPLSRSSYPQSRRHSDSPSYTGFRRYPTKSRSYQNDARHPRKFKGKNQYHAKRWGNDRSTQELSQEDKCDRYESSPARRGSFTSQRGFRKPIANHAKFGGKPKKTIRQSLSNKSQEHSYTPKAHVPGSKTVKSVNIANMEKCSKDNEVESASKLGTKSVKEKAEGNPKEELPGQKKPTKGDHKEVAECEKQNGDADAKPQGSISNHKDSGMVDFNAKRPTKEGSRNKILNAKCPSKEDASLCYVKLRKDQKLICRTKCSNPPILLSSSWDVDIVKRTSLKGLYDLPQFLLFPAVEDYDQKFEWIKFLTFLYNYKKVAVVEFDNLKVYVYPPESSEPNKTAEGLYFSHAVVAYELQELCETSVVQRHATSAVNGDAIKGTSLLPITRSALEIEDKVSPQLNSIPPTPCKFDAPAFESDAYVKRSSSAEKGTCSSISKCHEAVNSRPRPFSPKEDVSAERNFVRTDPSYLKTLGQAHSGWIFGAIAELVDNSRDARASRLAIAIETIYDKTVGSEIPMLSIIDNGVGMNHQEILRMISFGHKQPDEDNLDCIGRFGVGFKTGAMRLGRDALVLTQTTHSRSVAFLSQSLNEGKDNLEIPVVSYCRQAQFMEIDTSVQSEALAKYNLNSMKEFSPFNEYLIGEKAGLFEGNTGTQIYIWNLDKWGSAYTLEWQEGLRGGSSFHQGDIYIRSRRVRTRPGQTSRKIFVMKVIRDVTRLQYLDGDCLFSAKVHLDYSLRSYLEVIFLEPRMKIYVQGSLVKSRPLAKSLNNTVVINGELMSKQVQLTLGRCQVEWDEANCGIFLYWHGRLIEAYKRVGGMIHSADMGRGVIGVIDVTELMDDGNGGVWVHNNKQGFQDCEPYACLEEWLGKQADEYWDTYFDAVQLKKGNARYKPDNEWVQCDKCRKWRMLNGNFDSRNLPKDWFCYMEPFNGKCEMPEQKPSRGVITVGLKRSSGDPSMAADCMGSDNTVVEGKCQDESTQLTPDNVDRPVLKRLRRGPPRTPKN